MFKLYGSPISNFYNIVKVVLLEKGLDFEEVLTPPSQKPEFLEISPMGKIPVLGVREGYLSETPAIIDFLENVYPELALFPSDPYERAQIKRLCHMVDIYIDMPVRPLMGVSLGAPIPDDEERKAIAAKLEHGLKGLARVAKFDPWIAGKTYSVADIYAYYCLGLVEKVAARHLGLEVEPWLPGYIQWKNTVASRDFIKTVDADHVKAVEAFRNRRS